MQREEPGALPLEWPSGGFQWKPSWRRELPCVRGLHAPPLESLQALLAHPALLADPKNKQAEYDLVKFAKAAGCDWQSWSAATLRERMAGISQLPADPDVWLELMAQAASVTTPVNVNHRPLDWVVSVCVSLHGLTFALKAGLGFWDVALKADKPSFFLLFRSLRQAIASAPEPEYQEALAVAEALRKQSETAELACAHLFAHLGEWAQAWLARHDDHRHMLRDCVLPAADFLHYIQKYRMQLEYLLPRLYLQLHLHGEACFDALAFLYRNNGLSLSVLTRMRVPQLVPTLVADVQDRTVREALEKLASDYPVAVLKTLIEHNLAGRNRAIEAWTVRLALNHPGALAGVLAHLDAPVRERFEAALQALAPQEAPAAELPALLREPPWLRAERPGELPAFDIAALPTEEKIVWQARQLEDAKNYQPSSWGDRGAPDPCGFPKALHLTPAGGARLLQGQSLAEDDVAPDLYLAVDVGMVLLSPAASQLVLWNSYPARFWGCSYSGMEIHALLAAYGVAAIPGLLAYMQVHENRAYLGALVNSARLVGHMLHQLRHSRRHRDTAAAWVKGFARTVLYQALPQAFSTGHSVARDNAREGLRWLIEQGLEPLAREVAAAYGAPMPAALEALQLTDPLHVLPGVMPALPEFFKAASFRRPVLTHGGALPLAAVEHIGSMLLIGQPDAPYPGLALVKQACTSASLGDFAWDLYEAWSLAGGSARNDWAFTALGLLGDDETARRLMPRIQEWSVGANSVLRYRASRALGLLAAIGSDVALMHLNVLATKAKNKTLQERAQAMITAVAEARSLSMDELGDRLVPSLGLEQEGALTLDFGLRQFSVAFDEALRPFVSDAKGARLKDLPKPNKADDAALASAATQRYKNLKKDSKTVASLQVTRLEWAMTGRRRWPAAEFRRFFVEHPLVRHLAARLVWGVYEGERCTQILRVAEDFTLADANDQHFSLPEDASVGIPHVLEIDAQALGTISQVFADYEIAQPFKQLGRETYALSDEERQQTTLTRFENRDVASGGILGLIHRGWERGPAQERGMISDFTRRVSDRLEVVLFFTPGIYAGGGPLEPLQTLETVNLWRDGERGRESAPFSSLDPVLASEILRDLESLPAA